MSSISAIQTTYRQEMIHGFDKTVSVLRDTVTTEFMDKGGAAVFLVFDTFQAVANQRGLNGLIPANPLALTQNTATLVPWHHLATVSDFNVFASQGNLIDALKAQTMAALNRQIDSDIIAGLDGYTTQISAGGAMTIAKVQTARAILGNNYVPDDGNMTLLITPGALADLMQTTEFTNSLYVKEKPYEDGMPVFQDKREVYRWCGLNVIVDPKLTLGGGIGSTTEHCYMYHKNAIGQAINKEEIIAGVGFNEEQRYSWGNTTAYMATKVLQASGICGIVHDGSSYVSG